MPTIQVKHVPEDVHATLRRRAAAEGRSLQEHLLAKLTDDARRPTVAEVLAQAEREATRSPSLAEWTAMVREDRDSR